MAQETHPEGQVINLAELVERIATGREGILRLYHITYQIETRQQIHEQVRMTELLNDHHSECRLQCVVLLHLSVFLSPMTNELVGSYPASFVESSL